MTIVTENLLLLNTANFDPLQLVCTAVSNGYLRDAMVKMSGSSSEPWPDDERAQRGRPTVIYTIKAELPQITAAIRPASSSEVLKLVMWEGTKDEGPTVFILLVPRENTVTPTGHGRHTVHFYQHGHPSDAYIAAETMMLMNGKYSFGNLDMAYDLEEIGRRFVVDRIL